MLPSVLKSLDMFPIFSLLRAQFTEFYFCVDYHSRDSGAWIRKEHHDTT